MLCWGGSSHKGRVRYAEDKVAPGLQREQRLNEEELTRCFQVILEAKPLALMAPSRQDKLVWVAGLNAIATGLLPQANTAGAARK